jgi:hypothetical protein
MSYFYISTPNHRDNDGYNITCHNPQPNYADGIPADGNVEPIPPEYSNNTQATLL